MNKLIKYEFRKTWGPKLILLGITAAAEIAYLIALFSHDENWTAGFAFLLTALAVGGIMMMGLMSVVTLHRDMNTKQSYMLFMTPNSSYKILGAKVVENGLSILVTGAFFFALGALDIMLLFSRFGTLEDLWDVIQRVLRAFNQEIPFDTASIASFVFGLLTSWFAAICAAYLADVISSSLLNGKKYNGLLTFLLYIALAILMGWLQRTAAQLLIGAPPVLFAETSPAGIGAPMMDIMRGASLDEPAGVSAFATYIQHQQLIHSAVALVYSALLYICTAELMERKLSV